MTTPIFLPHYTGRRDGGPEHVRAIVDSINADKAACHTSHIDAWEDWQAYLEYLDEEAAAKAAAEEAAEREEEKYRESQRELAWEARERQAYHRSVL